jgi:hypothetical protein
MAEKFLSSGEVSLNIEFISTDNKWKQGISYQTKGGVEGNEKNLSNKIID